MPTPSTSDLPRPKSWDEFEDIVWSIYTRRWQDPNAQRYGRNGQAQKGVDIYGQNNGSSKYSAVQCKRYEDNKLNLTIITSEVEKVKEFSASIGEYIIATTASRDTKIQDSVREINERRISEHKFPVYIVFWEDLCSYLSEPNNSDLIAKYYSSWGGIFIERQDTKQLFQNELEDINSKIPQSILASPYWRITFTPQTYNDQLLASRDNCSIFISDNRIKKTGWSYPRRLGDSLKGSNWIGIKTWIGIKPTNRDRHEYWRFYQSGQFINISGTWQDTTNNIITTEEIIYTITAVFAFAENLCQQEPYASGINITIELNNVLELGLKVETDLNDLPSQYRKATDNRYLKTWLFEKKDIRSSFGKKALEAFVWFIECFCSDSYIHTKTFKDRRKELLDDL